MNLSRLTMAFSRYFLPGGSVTFWHTPIAPVMYRYSLLEDYYIDFSAKTAYTGPFDEVGIPVLDYRGYIGRQYNPCAVAQYALGWYRRWQQGEEVARKRFLQLADWLRDSLTIDSEGRGWWYYQFDLDAYDLKAPWASALAQGQGISVLLRAFKMTADSEYRAAADAAYHAVILPVEKGGLLRQEGDDVYLEEVVAERKTAILDGMIFTLFGLQDYVFVTGDKEAEILLETCLDTIERNLPVYDLGYWSRADLYQINPPMLASAFYHGLHVAQLGVLADLTKREKFRDVSERWRKYTESRINRWRAWINKAWFKLRYY